MESITQHWAIIINVISLVFMLGFYFSDYRNLKLKVKELEVDVKSFPNKIDEIDSSLEKSLQAFENKLDARFVQFELTLKQVELGFARLQGNLEAKEIIEKQKK